MLLNNDQDYSLFKVLYLNSSSYCERKTKHNLLSPPLKTWPGVILLLVITLFKHKHFEHVRVEKMPIHTWFLLASHLTYPYFNYFLSNAGKLLY